jgi:putative tryptophan/tyrosine transport system substrate-binding protein
LRNDKWESGEVQAAARALDLEVTTVEIRRAEDITPAFEAIEGRADALYVPTEALVLTNRVQHHGAGRARRT